MLRRLSRYVQFEKSEIETQTLRRYAYWIAAIPTVKLSLRISRDVRSYARQKAAWHYVGLCVGGAVAISLYLAAGASK